MRPGKTESAITMELLKPRGAVAAGRSIAITEHSKWSRIVELLWNLRTGSRSVIPLAFDSHSL